MTLPLVCLYSAWAVTLFDIHYFLGNVVAAPLGRIGTFIYAPLLVLMIFQGPMLLGAAKSWVWYPPFLLLVVASAMSLPTAINLGFARTVTQYLFVYYVLAVATLVYVRTPRRALPILAIIVLQFGWWTLQGGTSGRIWWDPVLGNYDGFGGLMVQGVGITYWFGMAARSRKLKALFYGLAAYCVIGVVASQARGAFLSLVLLAAFIWMRSPKKLVMGAVGVAAIALVIVGSAFLFPDGGFWEEIRSALEQGTTEGTGAIRWSLWTAAIEVFKQHPLFGVGGGNFGVFATRFFAYGEVEAFANPSILYGHNLHNSYMQILAEFGLLGSLAFGWVIVDFHKRNRAIHHPDRVEHWAAQTGGRFDLRFLARGLEAAQVANLLAGLMYATLTLPWYYMIWTANRMLWAVSHPPTGQNNRAQTGHAIARRRSSRAKAT